MALSPSRLGSLLPTSKAFNARLSSMSQAPLHRGGPHIARISPKPPPFIHVSWKCPGTSPDPSRACTYSFIPSPITVWTSGCLCYITSQRPLHWYIGCCRNCSRFSRQVGSLPAWHRPPPSPVRWAQPPPRQSTNTCTAVGVPPGLAPAGSSLSHAPCPLLQDTKRRRGDLETMLSTVLKKGDQTCSVSFGDTCVLA